ncbi:hypothetical protein GX645_02035 [Candidatus Sumerlaeota bacterium]|nr:hypothetical protein [Candidatus Sumerlaeales bacterium]NLD61213.1 hypothetical protein [Candidatus Sumerlaeota bacterium]
MDTFQHYSELVGKKLLLLGGHALMRHFVTKAQEMGVYTIVTDYVKNSPAKLIADEAYDVSTLDVDKLVQLAQDLHVDGVTTGYVDINLIPCCQICERLGLPFYATSDQIDKTINKRKFKELFHKHGIPVPDDIPLDLYTNHPEKVHYPIIVKPADNYSSKGISVCFGKEDLPAAIDKAYAFSRCKEIVVETFITYGDDALPYLTVQNGILSLSGMADRILNSEQKGFAPQPVGYFYPSKYIDAYYEQIHDKLQNMVTDIGLKNGSFILQGFAVNNKLCFFEMALRLSGGAGYVQIRHQNKIDQVAMHIRYALTGKFDGWDILKDDNPRFEKPACSLVILLRNGTIASIEGIDEIKKNTHIVDIVDFKNVNDTIQDAGTLNQVYARMYLCADTTELLKNDIRYIKNTLRITDTNGNNMILNLFDENKVY